MGGGGGASSLGDDSQRPASLSVSEVETAFLQDLQLGSSEGPPECEVGKTPISDTVEMAKKQRKAKKEITRNMRAQK